MECGDRVVVSIVYREEEEEDETRREGGAGEEQGGGARGGGDRIEPRQKRLNGEVPSCSRLFPVRFFLTEH